VKKKPDFENLLQFQNLYRYNSGDPRTPDKLVDGVNLTGGAVQVKVS
jgi:hypothetical protein